MVIFFIHPRYVQNTVFRSKKATLGCTKKQTVGGASNEITIPHKRSKNRKLNEKIIIYILAIYFTRSRSLSAPRKIKYK